MKKVHVIGKLSEIYECKTNFPKLKYSDMNLLLNSRKFTHWYKSNQRVINFLALAAPSITINILNATIPSNTLFEMINPSMAVSTGTVVQTSFWGGKGAILLHMLVVGFFTLVVSSFLKFTGRGDFIPLVAFVGGGIILYEVIGLFNDIYGAVKTLLSV